MSRLTVSRTGYEQLQSDNTCVPWRPATVTSTLGSRSTLACSETVIVESAPTTFELECTALKTSAAAADTGRHTAESFCAGGGTASPVCVCVYVCV